MDKKEESKSEESDESSEIIEQTQNKMYKKTEFSISMIKMSEVKKLQGPKIKEI
tara:strand:+ start:3194 stop:3355 length:162 start_codon:yes stop_codon:yes gene_type:complete